MRAVVQRVSTASVVVDDLLVGRIAQGALVLLGIAHADGEREASWLAEKVANLRIFNDDEGKMNLSLQDFGGRALVVSQFTLYGDARKGRRPSFVGAAQGPAAEALYEKVIENLRALGVETATGAFGATMEVELTNSGPVTILLDSDKLF